MAPRGSRQRSVYRIHFEAAVWMSGRGSGTKGRSNAYSRARTVGRRRAPELQTEAGGRMASSIAAAVTSASKMQRIDHGQKGERAGQWAYRGMERALVT